jgi:hypothetical protein
MRSCGKKWGKTISLLPTLTPSQRLTKCLFTMKILTQNDLYDKKKSCQFEGQKIHQKNLSKIYQHW